MGGVDKFRAVQAQRAQLIEHLLEPGEDVVDVGLAQSVEFAEMAGRGQGEGLMFLTDRRLIFRMDLGGSCARSGCRT